MGLVLRVLHAAQRMMQAPMDEGQSLAALQAELVGLLGGAGRFCHYARHWYCEASHMTERRLMY